MYYLVRHLHCTNAGTLLAVTVAVKLLWLSLTTMIQLHLNKNGDYSVTDTTV